MLANSCRAFIYRRYNLQPPSRMGGKDSPPPQYVSTPQQSPPTSWDLQCKLEQKSSSPPITYVPKSTSSVNLDMKLNRAPLHVQRRSVRRVVPEWPRSSVTPSPTSQSLVKQQEVQSSPTRSDGTASPIRLYMECIEPRTLSCAIVGDSAVGKTSLLMSYTTGKISDTHAPTIYDKFSTSVSVRGKRIGITLCDTSGQDDFAHLRPLCYPQLDAALICFSVVDTASYENVKSKWSKEIRRHCPGVPIILIGTQVDKREDSVFIKQLKSKGMRTVSRSEGNKLASLIKATSYVECSALQQLNVKNAFDEAIAASLELSSSSKKRTPQCVGGCTIL